MNANKSSLPFPLSWAWLFFNSKTQTEQSRKAKSLPSNSSSNNSEKWRNQTGPMSLIAEGTIIDGTVSFADDARIDGQINGVISCDKKVVLGPKSKLTGELTTTDLHIEGHFTGILKVHKLAYLAKASRLDGEVKVQEVQMESGAILNADCHIGS